MTLAGHTHSCSRCTFQWFCLAVMKPNQKVCQVDVAVHQNKQGPFCELCRHLIMAKRVAQTRNLPTAVLLALLRPEVSE